MHTRGSSDHLINDTDNRPSDLSDGTKAFTRKKIIHLHFVASRMKVSNYVDSDN